MIHSTAQSVVHFLSPPHLQHQGFHASILGTTESSRQIPIHLFICTPSQNKGSFLATAN
jgi:hypothetical protein